MVKSNQRVVVTKRMVKEGLMRLLEKKPPTSDSKVGHGDGESPEGFWLSKRLDRL